MFESSGQDVNQPTAGNKIGVSDKVVDQVYRDYATIDMTDADVDYEIVGGDYDDPPAKNVEAYGVVSWDKITMEEGNSLYEVQRQGSTSGRDAGSITDTFPDYRGIKLDVPSDGGDSGGTFFHIDNDTAVIVGIMNRASGNYTYGNAMVEVEDDLNISV